VSGMYVELRYNWNCLAHVVMSGMVTGMSGEECACAPTPPRLLPEPEPDHLYDHHSSEEELEVIINLMIIDYCRKIYFSNIVICID
jgi:hypothetical protein